MSRRDPTYLAACGGSDLVFHARTRGPFVTEYYCKTNGYVARVLSLPVARL